MRKYHHLWFRFIIAAPNVPDFVCSFVSLSAATHTTRLVLTMIQFPYEVKTSLIPGAGKGLFSKSIIQAGKVLIAPSKIENTISLEELLSVKDHPCADSSIRWFESECTVSPHWPDECYVNHSFSPNGLWHLGFVFALRVIEAGEEITMDYSHIIAPDYEMDFSDSLTGKAIRGLSWKKSLVSTTEQLLSLAKNLSDTK